MKKIILPIVEIVLSLLTFPIWFLKLFIGIGYLPNKETGEIVKTIFHHSMYENICDSTSIFIPYLTMAIIVISIIFNILNLIINSKKLAKISNIIFAISTIFFALLFLYASTVTRGY